MGSSGGRTGATGPSTGAKGGLWKLSMSGGRPKSSGVDVTRGRFASSAPRGAGIDGRGGAMLSIAGSTVDSVGGIGSTKADGSGGNVKGAGARGSVLIAVSTAAIPDTAGTGPPIVVSGTAGTISGTTETAGAVGTTSGTTENAGAVGTASTAGTTSGTTGTAGTADTTETSAGGKGGGPRGAIGARGG
jgi:hypothetical protein